MHSFQVILLIVLVQPFHPTISLSPENKCVHETLKANVNAVEFTKTSLGLGVCACRFPCLNLFQYVEFYIYNPDRNRFQLLFRDGSNANLIDHNKSTTVFVHGYVDNFQPEQNNWMNDLCRMESHIFNRNTIAFNYGRISRCQYISLSEYLAPKIGDTIHSMLKDVLKVNLKQVNCVGHSLGAHICGYAGTASGGQFERCYGLDLAVLRFGPFGGLKSISCQYVQVIHTDVFFLGTPKEIGHIDFYTNIENGYSQPHCEFQKIGCSHLAAVEYYKASLDPNNKFLGQSCKRFKSDSDNMNCRFGPHNKDNCTGVACFDTSPCAPYVISNL